MSLLFTFIKKFGTAHSRPHSWCGLPLYLIEPRVLPQSLIFLYLFNDMGKGGGPLTVGLGLYLSV